MVKRPVYLNQIATAVRRSSVTALLGPRQSGETTLARVFGKDSRAIHLDLEFEPDRRRLGNPELALGSLSGLVVLDEIQMTPEFFHNSESRNRCAQAWTTWISITSGSSIRAVKLIRWMTGSRYGLSKRLENYADTFNS